MNKEIVMSPLDKYKPHNTTVETCADGTMLFRSNDVLGSVALSSGTWLQQWSSETPETVFVADRSGAGWREETYQSSLQQVRALAASLLGRGLNAQTPILIMSGFKRQ